MIILSLFNDGDCNNDIEHYYDNVLALIDYLECNHIMYRTNVFSKDGIDLFVMLIDSKTKSPISYYQRTFDLPQKNFKFVPGGKLK